MAAFKMSQVVNSTPASEVELGYFGSSAVTDVSPDREAVSRQLPTMGESLLNVPKAGLGVIVETIDDTASSLNFGAFLKNDDFSNYIYGQLGPETGRFMLENRDAFSLTGGVATTLLGVGIAAKAGRAGTFVNSTLRRAGPIGTYLAEADLRTSTAIRLVQDQQLKLAQTGRMTQEGLKDASLILAKRGARRAAVEAGVINTGITEAFIGITGNQNPMLYADDDLGLNLALVGMGGALAVGWEIVGAGSQIRRFGASLGKIQENAVAGAWLETSSKLAFDSNLQGRAQHFWGDTNTDMSTQLWLQGQAAKNQIPPGATASEIAERGRMATALIEEGNLEVRKVLLAGVSGVEGSRAELRDAGVTETLQKLHEQNPSALYGAGEAGVVTAPAHEMIAAHESHVQTLKNKLTQLQSVKKPSATQLAEIDNLTVMIPQKEERIVGWVRGAHVLTTDEYSAVQDAFKGKITTDSITGREVLYRPEGYTNQIFGVTNELKVNLPATKGANPKTIPLESFSYNQQTALFAAADTALDNAVRAGRQTFTVGKDSSWFEIDLHLELLKRHDGARVNWPAGHDAQSMMIESLAQKATIFQKAVKKSGGRLGAERIALYDTLNLPTPMSFEPVVRKNNLTVIEDFLLSNSPDVIRKMPFGDVQQTLRSMRQVNGTLGEFAGDLFRLQGESFSLGRGVGRFNKENTTADLMVLYRKTDPTEWTRLRLQENLAQQHLWRVGVMRQGQTAVGKISTAINNSADYETAFRVEEVSAFGLTSTAPGMWNRSGFGTVLTQEMAARDNPVLLAMQRQFDLASRAMDTHITARLEMKVPSPYEPGVQYSFAEAASALRAVNNASSSQQLNNFMSIRQGWDLAEKPVTVTDKQGRTMFQFELEQTPKNNRLYKALHGKNLPAKDRFLRFRDGTPVQVDNLGMRYLHANQEIQRDLLDNGNQLLAAKGMTPLGEQPWHVSPTRLEGRDVSFVLDPGGKPIMVIAGNTSGEKRRMIAELEKDPDSLINRPGYRLASDQDIAKWRDVWDYPTGVLHDPSIPVVQKMADLEDTRSVLNPFIEFRRWEDNIDSIKTQYERMSRDIVKLNYDPALRAAEVRSALQAETPTRPFGKTTEDKAQAKNAYDFYLQLARGQIQTSDSRSRVGAVYRTVTDYLDGLWKSRYDNAQLALQDSYRSPIKRAVSAIGAKVGGTSEFDKLKTALGDQLPFHDTDEFLRQQFNFKSPYSTAEFGRDFNYIIASSVLRWGELAHGLVNTLSLPVLAPVVVRAFQQQRGETHEMWLRRIGFGSNVIPTQGGAVAIPNAEKMMVLAARDAINPQKYMAQHWAYANAHKYLDQEVAEMNRLLNDIRAKPGKIHEAAEFLDKNLSRPSDFSEKYARTFSHILGIRLAEAMGVQGIENINSIAHTFANKMIGNYSAINRPGIFTGPLGGSLGLFQTFGWNYAQRLYGYIENGQMRAIASQYATQGLMFGMQSEPGFQQFSQIWQMASNNSQSDPYDNLYKTMGINTADMVLYGGLAVIPEVFGMDGIAIASRGDANVRLPIIQGAPAPLKIAGDMIQAIGAGVDQFRDGVPGVSLAQTAEIFAAFSPNRPLQGITQLALGYSTDRRGNIINDHVRDGMSAAYKLMGTKELEEAKAVHAYYRQNQVDVAERDRRDRLNRALDSKLRRGNYDDMESVINRYFDSGGTPGSLNGYLADHMVKATNQRQDLQFRDAMSSRDMDNVMRAQQLRSAWGPE